MRPFIKAVAGNLLLLGAVLICAALVSGCEKEQSWKVGASAPEISVLDLKDRTVKLSQFRGKVVVLRFWASGCKACIAGLPAMDRYSKGREKDLAMIAVNMGNSKEFVDAFARGLHVSFPMLLDPALIASRKFGVRAVPTTFFIDRDGVARKVVQGDISRDLFERTVGALL
jgi:cytochrome c biogenesis protein CcmG, thiol:disulfide interchange protein DsbE